MAPQESAIDSFQLFIPLIDFGKFLHGTPHERDETARAILLGFQTAGFLYLKNYDIDLPVIDNAFATSADFFKRSQEEKDTLAWTTAEANRGYVAHGREKVSTLEKEEVEALKAQVPDLKESFEIGREGEEGYPNNWPTSDEKAKEFKSVMIDFHDRCKGLHVEVMRAIAVGMGLDETFFDSYTDEGDNTLRLLHYPSVPKAVFKANELQVRAGEHTDYGSITLLFQDNAGGLQVKSPDGTFVDATPIPGTVVVNAGDMLARWSNDTIKSTLHRVVEPVRSGVVGEQYPARYSMAYFCNPNFKCYIEAIPGTYGTTAEQKYAGVNSRDYLVKRLTATY